MIVRWALYQSRCFITVTWVLLNWNFPTNRQTDRHQLPDATTASKAWDEHNRQILQRIKKSYSLQANRHIAKGTKKSTIWHGRAERERRKCTRSVYVKIQQKKTTSIFSPLQWHALSFKGGFLFFTISSLIKCCKIIWKFDIRSYEYFI